MKTHILRCENFDSCTSLEDRLKWVKAGRVLLVMPEKEPPDLSRQDFIRLKRKAEKLHADLGLVSQDAALRQTALSAGLAVFNSNEEARKEVWASVQPLKPVERRPEVVDRIRTYRAKEPQPLPGWVRWLAFDLAILAILAMIAVFLPGAKVDLNLPREEQSAELIVPASTGSVAPDLIAGIPLYNTVTEVSATIQLKTSGTVMVGDKPATGRVIFTNMTDQPLAIPSGTIVRSLKPSFRFSVMQRGNLPAGPGTTITLQIEEMDGSGPAGNLPAGAIVAMDPPLGLSISVTNPQAFSGGTQKTSPALAQADLLAADAAIKEALVSAFIEKSNDNLPADAVLIQDSIVVDIIRDGSTPPPYFRALSSFEIDNTAKLSGCYYLERDLEQWAWIALHASLPTGRVSMTPFPQVETISIKYEGETKAYITIHANHQTIPEFDREAMAVQLRGLRPDEAVNLVSDTLIPGSQPVITLSPSWWFWLPFIPQRIEING